MFNKINGNTIKNIDNVTKIVIILIFVRIIYTQTIPYGAFAIVGLIFYMLIKKSNNNFKIVLCILSLLVMVLQYTDKFDIVISNILSQTFELVATIAVFYLFFRVLFRK